MLVRVTVYVDCLSSVINDDDDDDDTAFMANYFDHLLNFGTLAHLLEQMKLGSSQLECRC